VVVGGPSALGAGLCSMGIPKDTVPKYEAAIKSRRFNVVLHGSTNELAKAKDILKNMGHEVEVHSA